MNEIQRTEHLIIEALQTAGDWMDQNQIRKTTVSGRPRPRPLCTPATATVSGILRGS
jgi:hypothetical protein